MASISSLGIGSGLDLNGLLDQLNDAERGKLKPIERQIETQQVKISAYGELKGALSGFQTAANALNDASLYQSLSTSVAGNAVEAAAGRDAAIGQYAIEIERLATAGSLASARLEVELDQALTDSDQTLTLHFGNATGEAPQAVEIDIAAGSTLEDIRDAINAHDGAGVTASIVNDGEGYRLALMSSETGEAASITDLTFSDGFFADGIAFSETEGAEAIAQAGQDALLNVNGIPITSASNQVEGAIQGVTLSLTEEGSSTV
ncbi:MAG: flagellar filament capping protein FliD, partial [Billgrantia desiderata]